MSKYELGLVSVSFRSCSPEEIVKAVKEAGLTCIEWGSDVHAPYGDAERLKELVRLQNEYGIHCSSYGTYFKFGVTPIEELEGYIGAAKTLGTDVLRLWCGTKSGADMNDEEREKLISECREAAKIAEKHGVILCTECHRNTFTERLSDALCLMRRVDSPNFRTYWQPFQWEKEENNILYAEAIADLVKRVHVFQWKNTLRFPLSEGIGEWKRYLAKLPAPRVLLLEFMPDDRIESLKNEADSLRRIVAGEVCEGK